LTLVNAPPPRRDAETCSANVRHESRVRSAAHRALRYFQLSATLPTVSRPSLRKIFLPPGFAGFWPTALRHAPSSNRHAAAEPGAGRTGIPLSGEKFARARPGRLWLRGGREWMLKRLLVAALRPSRKSSRRSRLRAMRFLWSRHCSARGTVSDLYPVLRTCLATVGDPLLGPSWGEVNGVFLTRVSSEFE